MSRETLDKSSCCIIYNNNAGRRDNEKKARKLSRKLGQVEVFPIGEYGREEVSDHKIQIIFSGDGTINSIARSVLESEKQPFIVLAGGGSENQLLRTLKLKKHTIKTSDLFSVDELEKRTSEYRPAVIDGYGEFLVNGGFGKIETAWAKNHEEARRVMPTFIASYYSYLKGLFQLYPNLTFNMVLINNPTASLKLPKDAKVSEEELLEIEIQGKPLTRFFKAILAPFLWKTGIPIPKRVLKTTVATELNIDSEKGDIFTVDGECVVGNDNKLTVKRSREHLRLLALKS